ncbi:MAG: peptidase rane alanine aminopeptidase [Nitrosarchaeum sp.]|nr:peptidase rane alanine aminopeptidase [Nitrosarchaeum sp.]
MKVFPVNYRLEFEPIFKNFTFNGKETITIDCTEYVNSITLHCAELKIQSCNIMHAKTLQKAVIKTNAKKEEVTITIKNKIRGQAFIEIEFTGELNDRLLGFYRSQYKQNGETKYLATTQFEAADARRAFPCWDEPQVKATFDISIIAENKFTAISNMPVISKKQIKNKVLYTFAKTPVMSTYLIYLGVGEFEYLSSNIGKTQVRVITTKGNKSKGKYSLELGKKLLVSYEKYFGIKYPLPKLDLIAIPDFAAGAMENWGAITFRETILLYDPRTSSTKTKQYIAEVISHEIAHQWFGNLVTMKWWNDLWLNESFATFMATKFVTKFYPEWDLWNQFIEDAMNTAMGLDSLKTTHPIDVKVNKPSEIREIFDAISYDKGGCVLRMLEHYVGESNFQKGLKNYLYNFKYKNAEGQDLWNAIGKISKMPVSKMVSTWLTQPGFPVVESKGLWHIPLSI